MPDQFLGQAVLCSTPFGIGDDFAGMLMGIYRLPKSCSTPFDIGDDFAGAMDALEADLEMCSTPFGIGDDFAWGQWNNVFVYKVLNAFRHR